jgi:hypothetical protein
MIAFLILFLHVLVSPFKARARLEAEIIMLRHQLNVLRRRIPRSRSWQFPTDCSSSGSVACFRRY